MYSFHQTIVKRYHTHHTKNKYMNITKCKVQKNNKINESPLYLKALLKHTLESHI